MIIIPAREGGSPNWLVQFDPENPPDVFFDTNVWIGMGDSDLSNLERLEARFGFKYHYTVTNFAELVSHLTDAPSARCGDPFKRYQACFRKILSLCIAEVLPSPEMDFLEMTGLSHYLDPVWRPKIPDIMNAAEIIANAPNVGGVAAVNPNHYSQLREVDGASFRTMIGTLNIQPPIRGMDKEKVAQLQAWFLKLANFFLIMRPSNKRVHYNSLTADERSRFAMAFTNGAGKLFHVHVTRLAKKHINDGRAIQPNDLYDLMQLLLLRQPNRIFVTDDRAFYDYQIEPETQRFLPWTAFRASSAT